MAYLDDWEREDFHESVEVRDHRNRFLHVSTYKTAVILAHPEENIWLNANQAEKLGRALIKAAKLRRKFDKLDKKK